MKRGKKGLNSFGGVLAEWPFRALDGEGLWFEYCHLMDERVVWTDHKSEVSFMVCREFRERGLAP